MSDNEKLFIKALYKTARKLWSSALRSASTDKEFYEDMTTITKGDLVFEISCWGATGYTAEKLASMIGYVESFSSGNGVYKIKRLDNGEIVVWENAKFLRLPIELD